ncbi:MAG TPA: hypothetical protein PLH72_17250 [Vicinamibacterales bacterium]|nr:hypothetical protein [Vicinamibacterales bacterium]
MAATRLVLVCLIAISGLDAQAPDPLPDQEHFFAEVRRRLASNDHIQSRYSYRERSTELHLNLFGRMGTGAVQVFDVYPHPNEKLTYRRLIERDGRPSSADELAAQDRDYRKRLADWQRRVAREGTTERLARLRDAEQARRKDEARTREALDVFTFAVEGRATWDGEPAIVIRFAPRPDVSPRSREGRVAHAFTGRVWVHEHEYQVMSVEATAIDDVSFGWGLVARLYKGSTARFTRRRIDGAWLPAATRFEGTGRAMLVRTVVIDFSRDYLDYRAFEPADLPARLGWDR